MEKPKVKITVTIDADLVDCVRSEVANGAARSVSAYVELSIRGQLVAEDHFDSMIDEMLAATGGPLTTAERANARRTLAHPAP